MTKSEPPTHGQKKDKKVCAKRLTNTPKPAIMSTVDGGHQQDKMKEVMSNDER
jgi:hypothetical protein